MTIKNDTKNTDRPLAGVSVLVTRPSNQANNLCEIIENVGGQAVRFPAMEIMPIDDLQAITNVIDQLDSVDIAIFISANAVKYAVPFVKARRDFPEGLRIAAIGNATRKALEDGGLKVDIYPTQQFDSEALLALPQMQRLNGKRILIFRGRGGRELLKNSLQARGATIDYVELYERALPNVDTNALSQFWKQNMIDIVTVTSNQALDNLFILAGESGKQKLVATPIVVISPRMVQNAMEKGIKADILVAEQANDKAMLDAILKWRLNKI